MWLAARFTRLAPLKKGEAEAMSRTAASAVIVVLVWAMSLSAQAPVTVSGIVTDGSGAVVTGATVEAVVVDRLAARASTNEEGRYNLQVPAGTRPQLRVRAEGFADFVADLPVAVGPVTRDVRLQVGGVSDTVVVTASRGAESRTNVTNSVSVMTAEDIAALGST